MTQEELNKKKTDIKNSISKQQEKLKEITADIETKTKRLEEISVPDAAPSQEAVDISNYIEEQKKTKATIEEAISADQQKLKEYETIQPTESTDSNQSSNTNTMSQSDKEKNAKLAAEHPERVVDGIYYADDDALASAKEAYEKKVQEETKLATAEATANANKLAAAMKRINETLYGTDNQEVIEQLQGTVGGAELSSILGNAVDVRARQKLLDFKKFKNDFKSSNAGKPPHNKDPFPVDLKIEEFETHQPRVKVHQITTHNHGKEAAIMGIEQFDATEKRLVRLENNMSTLMRYIFRLGARVFINCHYYGGQSTFNKYKTIRCMKDDRCGDGSLMQIDQCLCCTRYEPIFGQVYECMNDIGVNVAQVLDDLQASYMNNDEYVRMSRIEEYNNSPKQGKIDLTKVLKAQNNDNVGFDDIWGNGIRMNWTLVPVEEQNPHINWRQAIDDDGSGLGRLASWYDINSGMTASIVNPMNNPEATNVYLRNQKAMDENKNNEAYSEYVNEGRGIVEHKMDIARSDYENKKDAIKSAIGNTATDLDVLAVLAGAVAYETDDYPTLVSAYRQCETEIGCSNPVLVWIAVGTSSTTVRAYVNGTLNKKKDENNTSSGSDGTSNSSGNSQSNTTPRKDPKTVLYVECVEEIKEGLEASGTASTSGLSLFPKICYLYVALMNDIKTSSFDGDSGWAFPFTDDIINENGEKAVFVTGRYGEQRRTHQHEGVDLQTGDNYSNPDKDVPFVAVKDGTVMDVNNVNWCNCIYIAHPDGTFSRYLHCRRALVSNGQQVKKGEKIGIVGNSYGDHEEGAVHLHVEFGNQIAGKTPNEYTIRDNCGIDPLDCWRKPTGTDATSGCPCWTL